MRLYKLVLPAAVAIAAGTINAAEPSGYYDSCKGKGGQSLLSALHSVMGSHTNVGYDGLWDVYKTSDIHPDGKVWDMYSTKDWGTPSQAKHCGNYSNVGDCINREHSMPKSWFNEGQPMKSDAFHVYPTDGKVNGQRSNYPYGECEGGTTLSNGNIKGLGRLGTSTTPGYSGKVFEPDDQYKGDFARTYFYMAAAYYDKIAGWSSDMLAGNNYPAYKTWAVDVLLKWHRQDPVDDKERDRNDAVEKHQHNRNPFIDHPELVEYVWGNLKSQTWQGDAADAGSIVLPVDGSTVDMGVAGINHPISATITVKGMNLTGNVSVTATNALQLSASTISASQANAGCELTATWTLKQVGSYTSKVTFTSGAATSEITVKARVADGLPATAATEVSASSFRANWTYVADDTNGRYTLDVQQGGVSIDGYPRDVDAAAGSYLVDGLEESTTYTYYLSSATMKSNTITVTTGEAVPFVQFLYDGELSFLSAPGEPSAAEEILVEVENVKSAYTVRVDAPFQISTDKTAWATSLTMQPEEDRIYMRLNSERAGTFTTEITATIGEFEMESGTVTGVCSDPSATFLEDFEANFAKTYTNGAYEGTACTWTFNNVGVVGLDSEGDRIYAGEKACRFGKNATSSIEMSEDKTGGAGTVSFYACRWRNTQGKDDPEAAMSVQYSTDGGTTWQNAGDVTISATDYKQYNVAVNVAGNVRVRLAQTEGQRLHLDNVEISNYGTSGIHDAAADAYYGWDAYAPAAGTLRVDTDRTIVCSIYGVDGITYAAAAYVAAGSADFALPAGLYIVVVNGQSRRVLVK